MITTEIQMAQKLIMMISFKHLNENIKVVLFRLKKIKGRLFQFTLPLVFIYFIFFHSCANQGIGPSGGPKDSIPPVVINSIPVPFQTMYTGKEIAVTFNEYVVTDNLTEKLVISPPLAKKPDIGTKGKSVSIKFSEDLIPDRTYSLDFQDGIKDYNENNKLKELRMVFSTGSQLDSLRIGGYILDAYTLLPAKNVLATLYTFDNDSVFQNLRPDFIARTNDEGYFLFDNLPPDHYKLYGLKDEDKNLFYSQATESIAFSDTMISPSVQFVANPDTVINGNDTIISKGQNLYSPNNVTILLFQEKVYNQFIVSLKRDPADKCLIVFNEPVTDSLKIETLDSLMPKTWNEVELSNNKDSVSVYITDSILAKTDTLLVKISYQATDSSGNSIVKTDTLKMLYSKTEVSKAKKKEDKPADDQYFKFSTNLIQSNFDINKSIIIESPSPIGDLKKEMIELNEIINDSTLKTVNLELQTEKDSNRKFKLLFPLAGNTKYQLTIDTAVVKTFTGIYNAGFSSKFSTQKADFYGSIILSLSGIRGKGRLLLIKYNEKGEKEDVIRELFLEGPQQTVVLDFLKPDKYVLKFVSDLNNNCKWDTGNLSKNLQPEPVSYFEKVINVKSNWEVKESWELISGATKAKKIVDESKEEKKSGK